MLYISPFPCTKNVYTICCRDVCEGIWDVVCFIGHICIADLVKFLLVCCLSYICKTHSNSFRTLSTLIRKFIYIKEK